MSNTKNLLTSSVSLLLVLACIFSITIIPANAAEIMPCYNNVLTTKSNASVSDNGLLTITYNYKGWSGITTKVVITTYIEKKILGLFWTRVDIGQPNDEWVDTIYNYTYTGSHSYQLTSEGTYRVTVNYVVSGSGGSPDKITKEITVTY